MRNLLLGTTAVVGAALLMPSLASAQEAPTVRIGGYFRAYYGYTQQGGNNQTNQIIPQQPADGLNNGTTIGGASPLVNSGATLAPALSTINPGATTATTGFGGGAQVPNQTRGSVRVGKNDFSTDAEIHVFVNGKAANGLAYGAVIELEFDSNEGESRSFRRSGASKTMASIDEAYAFLATPGLGQFRFGDEDGVLGGLMNSGVVTNFGTGGVYGDWEDFVVRQQGARTTTAPAALGDNTKVIYLSPQFFGFDFGASFALNQGEGADTGCISDQANYTCDRAYAFTGASAVGIGPRQGLSARRNEYQGALRWRGSLGGVGIAATGGFIGSGVARDQTISGTQVNTLRGLAIWQAGVQATAYGFTIGGYYQAGTGNYFWGNTMRGDQQQSQFFGGASYTAGPFTIGANYVNGTYAGASATTFNTLTGALTNTPGPNSASMRRYSYAGGANYRLAPGLDLVAEYVAFRVREGSRDLDAGSPGPQTRARADVFLVGTRLAF